MILSLNLLSEPVVAPRLTLQTEDIASATQAIRCWDWDRDRFDIEFELDSGTTYNSFLVRADRIALIDTAHQKFESLSF